MKNVIHNGFVYKVIIRPWLKGHRRYEVIKQELKCRSNWIRVPYSEYLKITNTNT